MLIREVSKRQTSPGSYGALAGAIVMLLGLLVNANCAHTPESVAPAIEQVEPFRTPLQRVDSAVAIYTECGSGTGVMVDGDTLLTAFHVVNCGDSTTIQMAQAVVVRALTGTTYVARMTIGDPARDIARIELHESVPDVVPVKIRDAVAGETVCAAHVIPERGFKCGIVNRYAGPRSHGDVIVDNANYWYGNSGSGVYAEDGQLIGIAVRLNWCAPGDAFLVGYLDMRVDTCDGRVSSITDSSVLP